MRLKPNSCVATAPRRAFPIYKVAYSVPPSRRRRRAAAAMLSLEDFYQDESADISEVYEYFEDPSIANAHFLLAAFRIEPPYSLLKPAKRPRSSSSPPAPPRSVPYSRRGGAPSAPTAAAAAALLVHERADVLHDLHPEEGFVSHVIVQRVLRGTDAAFARFPGLRDRVLASADVLQKATEFTYGLFTELNAAFGLRFSQKSLNTRTANRSAYDQVTRWRASPKPTEIVLDGLIFPPKKNAITETERAQNRSNVARSQVLCAFLQLMLAEYDPALLGAPSAASAAAPSLIFLIGPFQDMDIAGWKKYFTRWLGHLKNEKPSLWSEISLAEINVPVTSFSGAQIRRRKVVLPNGRVVPFVAPKGASAPKSKVEALNKGFAVSAKKDWLRSVFEVYRESVSLAEMDSLVDDVIAVNALRDAAKAEIALARGAVYVTYDRLAMMYYALRRASSESRGDSVWLFARGVGDAKLGAYE
jgi:hypothetical protein